MATWAVYWLSIHFLGTKGLQLPAATHRRHAQVPAHAAAVASESGCAPSQGRPCGRGAVVVSVRLVLHGEVGPVVGRFPVFHDTGYHTG